MNLIEEVADLVRQYRDSREDASINWLSKRAKVPYSTVRGIVQREVKDARTDNIVAILSVFMKQKDIIALLKKYGRDQKLREMYSAQESYELLEKRGFEWKSPDHAILALAATGSGTTREIIEEAFGKEFGIKRLEMLLDQEFLREINGSIKTFAEDFTDPDLDSVARQIEIHAQTWDSSQIDKGGFCTIKSHDLSLEAFEKIKDAVREALNRIYQIVDEDKGNKKEVVMLLNFLCSVYGAQK